MSKEQSKYNLPENWILTSIGEISIIYSGGTPDRKNSSFFKGNIPWVKSGELNHNTILVTEENINNSAIEYSSAKIFPKGTVLVALYGSTVGKLAILGIEAATNQAVAGVITTASIYNRYLYYYLMQNRESLLQKRQGGAQPNISQKILSDFVIPLPSTLCEQYQIVEKIEELFSELDKAEETLRQGLHQLRIYELSVLNKMFRTDNWKSVYVKDLFEFIGGGTPSKRQKQLWGGDICWATVKDINAKYLNDTKDKITKEAVSESSTKMAKKGDVILVTRISPGRVSISNVATAINQDLKIVRPRDKRFTSDFMYYLFNAYYKEIISLSSGTTVKGINLSQLNNLQVFVPSFEKYDEIVQELDRIYSLTANMSKEIENSLKQITLQRHSILKKAYEGGLVSQNSGDEQASELLDRIKKEEKIYLLNQKNITQMSSQIKSPKKQLIDILFEAFDSRSFTFEDIKSNVFMSYEDLKSQLFSLLENKSIRTHFDSSIGKITYRINNENQEN